MLSALRQRLATVIAGAPLKRGFEAATGGRRASGFRQFGPYATETLAAAPIRGRARHFAANNAWAASGVNVLTTALVGAGITPASLHPDAGMRELLGDVFNRWNEQADADGLTDFNGLQAFGAASLVTDGEFFLQLIITDDGLRLRLLPSEMVNTHLTRQLDGGARIIAGVEFDAAGKRVAYWVNPMRPTDVFTNYMAPVRLPASDIIHVFRPLGAGQVRGVSWLAPVLLRLSEMDQLEDALLVGAKVAAMHAGFLVDQNGSAAVENPYSDGQQCGSVLESGLEPGTLKFLPQGWDVKFSAPAQANESIAFAQLQLRAIAAGLGIPEHLLTGDLRGANYSSLRAGLVAFRQRLEQIQFGTLIPQLMRPIWERVITTEVLRGTLDAPGFESQSSDYFAVEFYPPAQPWVDPMKDIQAEAFAVTNGFKSRRQVVAAQGYSIEAIDADIAADRVREAELGLQFGAPAPAPNTQDPNNADQ